MKKRGKICLVALLALALLLSLTGCGGPETPEKVMEKAEENLEKIDSMSFEIGMTMGLSAMGESLDMAITMGWCCNQGSGDCLYEFVPGYGNPWLHGDGNVHGDGG